MPGRAGRVNAPVTRTGALTRPARRDDLQWSADAAVLAHAPKVDGDEDGDGQGDGDAVQDIEAQQRLTADEASAQQNEPRVGAGMDERDVTHFQERRSWPLVAEERRGAGHVAADGDGPDGQLVPRQQIAGEAQ